MNDLVPFFAVFVVTLFTFTGGLYLLLRQEEKRTNIVTFNIAPTEGAQAGQKVVTSLDNFPSETGYVALQSSLRYFATMLF